MFSGGTERDSGIKWVNEILATVGLLAFEKISDTRTFTMETMIMAKTSGTKYSRMDQVKCVEDSLF